jgi:DNA polymerase III epsilon subunit-like protein
MRGMTHWFGDMMCVIDTETSGLDPDFHEILQICIMPVDSNIDMIKTIKPFFIELKPRCPELITPQALKVNRLDLNRLMTYGIDQEKAKELFREWFAKLNLPLKHSGASCKIRPLGHNYIFDKMFIIKWLGVDTYDEFFDYHSVDTMCVAMYLNDQAAMHGRNPPYQRVSLVSLCNLLSVENPDAHNALGDCVATAGVYKKLIQIGLL